MTEPMELDGGNCNVSPRPQDPDPVRRTSIEGNCARRPSAYDEKSQFLYKSQEIEWEQHRPLGVVAQSGTEPDDLADVDHESASAEDTSSAEGGNDEASGPNVSRWLEYVFIRLKDPTDEDPSHLILRSLQHNAFVMEEPLDCDCQVGYSGPETEDLVLRVFTGCDPRRTASFTYVGHIHSMQADARTVTVKFGPKGTTRRTIYYLGVELLNGLNKDRRRHEPLVRDPWGGLPCPWDCDFLVVWSERDQSRNTTWVRHLTSLGPRRGPGDTGHRALTLCTDWTLGMGQHFGTHLDLNLGRRGFGLPLELSARAWFEDLLSAARLTRYGVLIVSSNPQYFRSRDSHQELFDADWARLFVYEFMQDCILSAEDYARQLAEAPPPIVSASEKGNYLEIAECIRENATAYREVDRQGNTTLAISSVTGELDAVRYVLRARADVEERNYLGVTALYRAVQAGNVEVARELIKARANVDGPDDHLGLTPLHEAARLGRCPVVTLLMEEGANARLRDKKGHTAHAHAYLHGHMEVVNALQHFGHWQ